MLDRLGLPRQVVEIKVGGQPAQQIAELVYGKRCFGLHLPLESNRFAPGQVLF
jgi:hypothetical protein